ncbi:triple tyrosine motif-containing protein [Dyella sp. C11]|uniref:sensor histidine kinase n=1 Tax=Dyella sp. C11 TaxID=2126991 RepID=UPI000D64195D|nr:triple tyrosine motif-containing protein [Dyella sp. C11]
MLLALSCCAVANGQPIEPGQYVHQSWTVRDGAPSAVCVIAQAPDGYLWLGTGTGLFRFDGVQFSPYRLAPGQHLLSNDITALTFASDGGLWIGSYAGGANLLKDGQLTSFSSREGFPSGWVLDFTEGPDGDVWVATGQGLGRFDGKHWQSIGNDWDYPEDRADWVVFDKAGTLWVAAVNQLRFLQRGASKFQATNVALAPGATLAIDNTGTLWASDRLHGTRPLRGLSADHPTLPRIDTLPVSDENAALRLAFAQLGGLWGSGLGTGVVLHVADAARIGAAQNVTPAALTEIFSAPRGLTADTAIPVASDREGTVWVGTSVGIDSYRRGRVGTLRDFHIEPSAHVSATEDAHHHLWLASQNKVYRLDNDTFVPVITDAPDVQGLLLTRNDTLWVIGFRDLYREHEGHLENVPLPNHLYSSRLKFVAPGLNDDLWASIDGMGIFRFTNNAWVPWTPRTKGVKLSPTTGAAGLDGSLWLGYTGSEVLYVDRTGGEHFYDTHSGLDIGSVQVISMGTQGLLLGGNSGLARFHQGAIQSLTDRDFPDLTAITGIVQEADGSTWLNTGRGIVYYTAQELERAFGDPHYHPIAKRLDFRDGVQGVARQGQPTPTMQSDDKGRLWFLTGEQLQWMDPANQPRNPHPPPVHIKSVLSGGKSYSAADSITLPPGGASLQIDYTALSLASPSRVRFRYRLDGVDKDWIDPGARRQAYYTNLPPGTYRFDVIASNDDGIWNNQGASIAIDLPPRFYQTAWFHMLEILLGAGALGLAYLLRVRRVAHNVLLQSEARHAERERIARELHDTLLQAIHALALRFQSVAATIPENDPVQQGIRSTLKLASGFIVEGRDRVKALRTTLASIQALAAAVLDLAQSLEKASSVTVVAQIDVDDQAIDSALGDELFAICRESLINAFQHANASRIDVLIGTRKRHLHISIADNGTGMAPDVLARSAETGHWGLVGMRERARQLGAHFAITSGASGTTIALRMPLRTLRRRLLHARVS